MIHSLDCVLVRILIVVIVAVTQYVYIKFNIVDRKVESRGFRNFKTYIIFIQAFKKLKIVKNT